MEWGPLGGSHAHNTYYTEGALQYWAETAIISLEIIELSSPWSRKRLFMMMQT